MINLFWILQTRQNHVAVKVAEEAAAVPFMAGASFLFNQVQNYVCIAVDSDVDNFLQMSGFLAFFPQFLPGTAEIMRKSGRYRQGNRLFICIGKHENIFGSGILDNNRNQTMRGVFEKSEKFCRRISHTYVLDRRRYGFCHTTAGYFTIRHQRGITMFRAAAIFEGGGMRGGYATGVIDSFLDHSIEFSRIYAVSAGACHAASFISKQRNRAFRISTNYLHDKDYCSIKNLITTGNLFGADMLFNRLHTELDPFDYETFEKYAGIFYATVTNVETGEAEYLPVTGSSARSSFKEVQASSAIPLLATIVDINGKHYLDGFVGDSVPIRKSLEDGNRKNILILTRPKGYRKGEDKTLPLVRIKYRKYPEFVARYADRPKRYNETMDFIDRLEQEKKIVVIRPKQDLDVGMVTKDKGKLQHIYNLGFEDAEEKAEEILAYLTR